MQTSEFDNSEAYLPEEEQTVPAPSVAQQVVAYIEAHCTEKMSCMKIAQEFSYHPNSLNRIMHEELGYSLRELITRVKIDEAIRLLIQTDMSIADIAYRLNFYDHAHFAKAFRRMTGCCPSEYREAHQASKAQNNE